MKEENNSIDDIQELLQVVEKPFVEISGIKIMEPATAITDLLLTIICFYFFIQLQKRNIIKEVRFWKFFFLWLSISTLLGAVSHGLYYYIEGEIQHSVWIFMQVCSGLAIYFAEYSTIKVYFRDSLREKLLKLVAIKLMLMVLSTLYFQHFSVVVLNSALGFLSIIYLKWKHYLSGFRPSGFIIVGILFAIVTALIHAFKFSFNNWFNHNDISHVVLMLSTWLIFIGINGFKDYDVIKQFK